MTAADVTVGSVTALPPAATDEAFTTVCQDETALRPGVERLCRRLGVDEPRLTRFAVGSRPVYAAGDVVLKLFPPVDLDGCRAEAAVLGAVQGKLPVPTPRVHARGEHDGWGYVLMSRLPGVALDTVWDRVSAQERDGLADLLGDTVAALHEVPPPEIPGWWPADWGAFVARRRADCISEQRSSGLPEPWAGQLDDFLDMVTLPARPPVLLHTEIMSQHLLVTESAGGWRLSGLIDFEPAMRGEREYEFVAVGVFVARGDARFLTRTLTAYGYGHDQLGPELRQQLLAWGILHRHSHLAWWMRHLPGPSETTLSALADRWFATE
jgi:hygromycin-B 7''-O-kinase